MKFRKKYPFMALISIVSGTWVDGSAVDGSASYSWI